MAAMPLKSELEIKGLQLTAHIEWETPAAANNEESWAMCMLKIKKKCSELNHLSDFLCVFKIYVT